MTHDKPYLRPHTASTGATVIWGAKEYELSPNEMLLWIGYMIQDLQSHRIVVVPEPAAEVRDE
jgi:hypothetical protein